MTGDDAIDATLYIVRAKLEQRHKMYLSRMEILDLHPVFAEEMPKILNSIFNTLVNDVDELIATGKRDGREENYSD